MLVSSLKLSGGHDVCPVWSCSSIKRSKCQRGTGIGAHDEPESLPTLVPESVPTLHRNRCPRCAGIRTRGLACRLPFFIFPSLSCFVQFCRQYAVPQLYALAN